jgi:hypothetical protein
VTSFAKLIEALAVARVDRVVTALAPLHPRLRGAPPHPASGLNFTLVTDAGEVDLLGEVVGLGAFAEAVPLSSVLSLFGHSQGFCVTRTGWPSAVISVQTAFT